MIDIGKVLRKPPEGESGRLSKEECKRRTREYVADMRKRLARMSKEEFTRWLDK